MSQKIDDLIAAGNSVPEGECEVTEAEFSSPSHIYIGRKHIGAVFHDNAYGDDFCSFIQAAANAREDIKAMREENKKLRSIVEDAYIWFDIAIKGDLMSAKNAGLIHRKLKQALGDKDE